MDKKYVQKINQSPIYSFGFMYYYGDKFKNDDNIDEYNDGFKKKDFYITKKHLSLKEELL